MRLLNFFTIKTGLAKSAPAPFCSNPIFLPKTLIQTSPSCGKRSGLSSTLSICFFISFQESNSFIAIILAFLLFVTYNSYMNILLIITKGEIGGAQVFVSTLAKILHAQGHKVTVACGEGDYLRDTLAPEGISIVRFNSLRRT